MSLDTAIVRQEEIRRLQPLCRALAEAIERRGVPPDQARAAWGADVAATCPRCGIAVSGVELLALSQPPAAETASAKIGRLRLGDCARRGCDSYHCLLTFKAPSEVNWLDLLSEAEGILHEQEHPVEGSATPCQVVSQLAQRFWRSPSARRVWIVLAAVLFLTLARQWYRGGSIPLIREPEHFRVDPTPQEEVAH
jgi:hypothetical protein